MKYFKSEALKYYTRQTCNLCETITNNNNNICNCCSIFFSKLTNLEKKLKNSECIFCSVFAHPAYEEYECVIHDDTSKNYPGHCDYKDYFVKTNINNISTREDLINIIVSLEKENKIYKKKNIFYMNKNNIKNNIRKIYKDNGPQIENPLNLIGTVYNIDKHLIPFESEIPDLRLYDNSDMSIDSSYYNSNNEYSSSEYSSSEYYSDYVSEYFMTYLDKFMSDMSYKNILTYKNDIKKIQRWAKRKLIIYHLKKLNQYIKKIKIIKIQIWIKKKLKKEYFTYNILCYNIFKYKNYDVLNHIKFYNIYTNNPNLKCPICIENFNFDINLLINNIKKFTKINIHITSCNHIFHKTCIYENRYKYNNKKCPLDNNIDKKVITNEINHCKSLFNEYCSITKKNKIIKDHFNIYNNYGFFHYEEYLDSLNKQKNNIKRKINDYNILLKIINKIQNKYNIFPDFLEIIKKYIFNQNDFNCNICSKSLKKYYNLNHVLVNNYNIEGCNIYITECNCLYHKSCIYNKYQNNNNICPKCNFIDNNNNILKAIKNDIFYKTTKKFKYELTEEKRTEIEINHFLNEL
jgi:hypothetical protein